MLACNAELAPAAKFTLAADAVVPCLAAELRLGEEEADVDDLAARIAAVCDGFSRAVLVFSGGCQLASSPAAAGPFRPGGETPGELSAELAALCKEVGWPLAQRAANYVVFELDVPGSFYQAVARPRGPSGLQLGVDLASAPDVSGARQQALDVLLLHASHCVRTARATVRTASGVTAYGWEVLLDRVANSRELEYVLGALSVACRLSAREVSAFQQDDCLSRSYLKLRGWCS
jgi:hypothetical protein